MSTKKLKMKIVKASLLTLVFLCVGLLGVSAQTSSDLGTTKSDEVKLNLRNAAVAIGNDLPSNKAEAIASESFLAISFYENVYKDFNQNVDLSVALESRLMKEGTDIPLNFLSQTEVEELKTQIEKVKSTNASMLELDAFNTLFNNSKN